MPLALLRFPFLIQKVIFEEIDLLAVLSITTLSKKSRATARETACLRHYKFHLRYLERESFRLEQKFEDQNNNIFDFLLIDQARPPCPCPLWHIGNQEVRIGCSESSTLAYVYSDNISNFATETLRYLSITLPNLSVTLEFRTHDAETFRRTVHSVEGAEEIKEISVGESREPQDEFVKVVLDESQRAKNLNLRFSICNNFVYPTRVPLKFDSISMTSAGWISRNTFIKLFLSCKSVELHGKDFKDEDITAIFRAWTEGSSLEFLQFFGNLDFYREKTLGSILEGFAGAAPVRNTFINFWRRGQLHIARPGEGKCYRIQQRNAQTTALVCIVDNYIVLTTNFEIVNNALQ
ncbi:hypothetical protein CAEBREN_25920 [Caenorhabditis brenneri]|uniref:F-box domain-containing protein n=1 Tax=Caenorhabditis brenneri TaxID=135651 RepID=G0NCR9_CAEBE|nr:hypothetical protein CAEBREN_25920 [Caenorhabditis brenneri]